MANRLGNYDALVIPTGEPLSGERSFPVTKKALELFKSGKYGCIFITGGYGGFATKQRKQEISEAKETYEYIMNNVNSRINSDNVYYDEQSLESVGNFSFPEFYPVEGKMNPRLSDFEKMVVVGQEGHIWRLKDYAKIVLPEKFERKDILFYSILGKHNNGLMARVYHNGLMNAIGEKRGSEVHDFLINEHPFYSEDWYNKGVNERKILMAVKGLEWNLRG